MATVHAPSLRRKETGIIPPLEHGDHLTRQEFRRRYEAMPQGIKAELIEGVVFMPSPVTLERHGEPHADFIAWLGYYRTFTPGVRVADNATVELDDFNEPQPDTLVRVLQEYGGQARVVGGYLHGASELVGEIAASTVSYDLHEKLESYQRHGVQEYVVWRVLDEEIDWFVLRKGRYARLRLTADGLYKSKVFPGLWLDPAALLRGEMQRVFEILQQGLASPEHARFKQRLLAKKAAWERRHTGGAHG
jgi:Uma2 family endonuclease